jgi:hypothetical protein
MALHYVDAVSGSGSDSNSGTGVGSAFATVAHAAAIDPTGTAQLRLHNGNWVASPPYQNLKALYIGQLGPNSGLIYDIANGHHATLTGGTGTYDFVSGNTQLQCLKFNGTSDYATIPALIGNSDFIAYVVTSGTESNGFIWQEINKNDRTGLNTIGMSSWYWKNSHIFDGNPLGFVVIGALLLSTGTIQRLYSSIIICIV